MLSSKLVLALWPITHAIVVVFLGSVFAFIIKLYGIRRRMVILRKQGLSMPPYNLLLGNLIVMKDSVSKLPSDAHPQYFAHQIRREMPDLGGIFYLDMYPFIAPILIVASPSTTHQITQEHPLAKFPGMRTYMRPITGEHNLLTMEGQMWKTWRGVFNPGFNSSHLVTLLPAIVEEVGIFCSVLQQHETNDEIFPLKKDTDNLTMDVIGRLALDLALNSQTSAHPMVNALRRQVPWLSYGTELNLWKRWHPLRPFIHWYNSRIVDRYIGQVVQDRFAVHSNVETACKEAGKDSDARYRKSMIDLALDTYMADKPDAIKLNLDATFKTLAMTQIKLFLFSGHDTTSSSICYIFHNLSQHLSALQCIRDEHDRIFGSESRDLSHVITTNPSLLNQIPFTVAVIKETLRLFPPVSSTRAGETGFSVSDTNGQHYPTEGCLVWSVHQALHRDPFYWAEPDAFIPERWMVPPGDPLYPVKGAWRPFEFGPRNCIGQELAMIEMKVVMIMTLRRFDLSSVYEEWDRVNLCTDPRTVNGERAYQAGDGAPSARLPCRVKAAVN